MLHVINDLTVGGAEVMLYRLLSRADPARLKNAVISLKGAGTLDERVAALGVPVFALSAGSAAQTPGLPWRLARLVRRVRPDVIQGWLPHGNLAALLAGKLARRPVPVVWNIRHSLETLKYEKPATAKVVRAGARLSHRAAAIIYNSRTGAAQHAAFGYRAEKSVVIHNGFDTALFAPSAEARRSVRSELGLDEDAFLVGLVGRYHPVKNHPNFLRAAALLRRRHPRARFVLAGRGVDPGAGPLRELIAELGLTDAAHLLGERQDTARITAALDVAALASHGEGFPNVVGEAMACAVPCAVTDVSDLAWMVGEAGRVVPRDDAPAMAAAFAELAEMGAAGREALGRAGRERVIKHFRLEAVAEQYRALYEGVAAGKACAATAAEAPGDARPGRAWVGRPDESAP